MGREAGAACLSLLANWSVRFRSRFAYWIDRFQGLRSLPRSLNRAWAKVRHFERSHQGLKNELIEDRSDELNVDGSVVCWERLGAVPSTTIDGRRDVG